jgi:hypothetical protein
MSGDVRERLDDLVAPPPGPDFRERLWERVERRERVVERRWRLTALAAIGVAIAAMSGAGVLALSARETGTIDRTISCPVPIQGGIPVFVLKATARTKELQYGKLAEVAAQLGVAVNQNGLGVAIDYAGVTSVAGGFSLNSTDCRPATRIPLAPAGLPKHAVYVRNGPGLTGSFGNGVRCWSGARITIRLRTKITRAGAPVSAELAIRTGKKARPVAFVDWTPDKITAYLSSDCRD